MTLAHGIVEPGGLWSAWNWQPVVLLSAAVIASMYAFGVRALWSGPGGRRAVPARRVASFYAGLACSVAALVSPLHRLGETLFSAHMVQHLLLMLGAAPLLVYGAPLLVLSRGARKPARRVGLRLARASLVRKLVAILTNPLAAWALGAAALWAWHLPKPYSAALRSEPVHALEHASFLAAAMLFWSLVIPTSGRRRLGHAPGLLVVFGTGLQSACLGVVLTFAADPLYAAHAAGARAWGLSPLEDQQLAGALMWVPPGFVYLATMAVLFLGWLKDVEGRVDRAERLEQALAMRGGPR